MKRLIFIFMLILFAVSPSFSDGNNGTVTEEYDQGFMHPYGIVAYKNMVLVSNYGVDDLSADNVEGKGYVCAIQAGVVKPFIRPDGHLTAPKGMAVLDNFLFIADLNKIVIYNLKKIVNPPVEISFPDTEMVLTDLVIVGSMLLVSVNDTGKIFGIDLSGMPQMAHSEAILMAEVPGAGNMALSGSKLLVNSFSSEISDSSLLYVGELTSVESKPFRPYVEKMSPGQYLGVAVSKDQSTIFLSALKTDDIYRPMLYSLPVGDNQTPRVLDAGFTLSSPTSILVIEDDLWVVDHMQSKVYRYNFKQ